MGTGYFEMELLTLTTPCRAKFLKCTHTHHTLKVLLDDFSSCGGYKFLRDYLLHLEQKSSPDDKEAVRNMVLLIQNLCMAGFLSLEPQLSDGGPFQDPEFTIPVPVGESMFEHKNILSHTHVHMPHPSHTHSHTHTHTHTHTHRLQHQEHRRLSSSSRRLPHLTINSSWCHHH